MSPSHTLNLPVGHVEIELEEWIAVLSWRGDLFLEGHPQRQSVGVGAIGEALVDSSAAAIGVEPGGNGVKRRPNNGEGEIVGGMLELLAGCTGLGLTLCEGLATSDPRTKHIVDLGQTGPTG